MARGDDPLHVFQLADGRWRGQISDGYLPSGSPRRYFVHGRTKKEAQDKKKAKLREVARGEAEKSGKATVRSWAEQWLPIQERERRPKTYRGYRTAVKLWIVPTIGKRKLGDLTPADIRAVAEAVRKAGRTSTTARHHQVVLTKMLKDAVQEGHPVPARALGVRKPAKAVNDRSALPIEDALAVLKVAAGDADGSRWAAAFLQGMRQAECLGLTWDMVDLEAGTLLVAWQLQALSYVSGRSGPLRIPDGYEVRQLHGTQCLVRTKTARGNRTIPLVPWITRALTAWRDRAPGSPHGLVWPREDGQPRTVAGDIADWRSLQDRARIARVDGTVGRRWYVHEIRHTTATLLMSLGVDETIRTAILGHASITTTRGYQHADQPHIRAALESAAARLGLVD